MQKVNEEQNSVVPLGQPLKDKMVSAAQVTEWLARRCQYGPPCGRCDFCGVAKFVNGLPELPLSAAMRVFDSYSLIALQRAMSPDGRTSGYRCSIPLYASDPNKAGQLMATVDGDGNTAAEAILNAVANVNARAN